MKQTLLPLLAAALVLGTGCKTPVVFTTHTSLGLDVSGTAQMPNKVSFSYNRFEAAIVPRKTNGESHSVYGGVDADLKFFGGHIIKQTFATGKAAMLATDAETNGFGEPGENNSRGALVFATATTFGLHLTAGEQQMSPNLLLGYRRSEAAMVPVPDPAQEVRSVYADLLINSSTDPNNTSITTNFSALRGVRIKQSFATGRAAEALAAGSPEMRAKLAAAAGVAVARDIMSRNHQRGLWVAEEISAELDRLDNAQLNEAITAFQTAGLLTPVVAADLANNEADPRTKCLTLKKKAKESASPNQLPTTELHKLEATLSRLKQIQ